MFKKILGAAFILISSLFISKTITESLKRRTESLKSFERLLVLLESEINYANNPLEVAFSNISQSVTLGGFLPFILSNLNADGIKSSWQKGIKKFKKELALSDGDTKILLSFASQLGSTDRDNQRKNIQYTIKLLEPFIQDAEENYRTLSKLYRNISFYAGIGTIILLI